MLNFTAKLKGFHKNTQTRPSSAIFGELSSGTKLSQSERSRLRIGFWPIQSRIRPIDCNGIIDVTWVSPGTLALYSSLSAVGSS